MWNSTFVYFSSSSESIHRNRNKSVDQDKLSFESSSCMLKNKESDRIFYSSKICHSRHNSHSDPVSQLKRSDGSQLFRSNDSTADNTSLRSSNKDSDHKSEFLLNELCWILNLIIIKWLKIIIVLFLFIEFNISIFAFIFF